MGAFGIYMIKSSLCLLLFYVFFKALLSRDTFFRINRFILLGGVALCFIFPICRLTISDQKNYIHEQFQRIEDVQIVVERADEFSLQNTVVDFSESGKQETIDTDKRVVLTSLDLWLGFYILGGVGVLIWYIFSFVRIGNMIRMGKKMIYRGYKLVLLPIPVAPFSWGNYIVMSETDYREHPEEILLHEQMHIEKKHTLDLIYMELLLVFHWYNPVAWLLKKELQEIHEYEADNGVIDHGIDATKYQLLLVKKAVGARLYSIANSFNHSKLKNRITMMLKEKSNHWARLKVALLLPLAAFMFFAFARPGTERTILSDQAFKITQISDEPDKWSEEFFKLEYKKNALKFGLPQHYGIYNKSEILIKLNWNGNVSLNNCPITMAELPKQLKDLLKLKLGGNPVITLLQKNKQAPTESWQELLTLVGEVYQKVRLEMVESSTDPSSADPDRLCPIVVFISNYIRLDDLPPKTTVITFQIKGEGFENQVGYVLSIQEFEEKLDKVENLKQCTVFKLDVRGYNQEEIQNILLQKLRERGVLKVDLLKYNQKV